MNWMLIAQQVDPLSGGAGWLGAGLLGAVLAWLCFVHLPAKDKQLKEMMSAESDEREKERQSRDRIVSVFQAELLKIQDCHLRNAERDREAFAERNRAVVQAIEMQTLKLEKAIGGGCFYRPAMHPPQQPKESS